MTAFPSAGLLVVRTGTRGGDPRSPEDGLRWEVDVGQMLLRALREDRPEATEPHRALRYVRSRPYDRPERLADDLAPFLRPPLAAPGPARARAATVAPVSRRVGRRRLVRLKVRCPAPGPMPCAGEVTLETAPRAAVFSLAPGTEGTVMVRVARRIRRPVVLAARATVADAAGTTSTETAIALDP